MVSSIRINWYLLKREQIITVRISNGMRKGNVFTGVSIYSGGRGEGCLPNLHPIILVPCPFCGVPQWLVPGPFLGGTPVRDGGCTPVQDWGYPSPRWGGGNPRWGTPWPGMGYPWGRDLRPVSGVPPGQDGVPPWDSKWSTCYAAGGMPLAFTQENCLVSQFKHILSSHNCYFNDWLLGQVNFRPGKFIFGLLIWIENVKQIRNSYFWQFFCSCFTSSGFFQSSNWPEFQQKLNEVDRRNKERTICPNFHICGYFKMTNSELLINLNRIKLIFIRLMFLFPFSFLSLLRK